jgi:hypothetical protein
LNISYNTSVPFLAQLESKHYIFRKGLRSYEISVRCLGWIASIASDESHAIGLMMGSPAHARMIKPRGLQVMIKVLITDDHAVVRNGLKQIL